MKKLSAPLLLALGLCIIPALAAADKKPTAKPAAAPAPQAQIKADPKAAAKTGAKDSKATAEEEKPIVGTLIERKDGSGGFLNLKVDNGNFVIVFLDKDKKATEGNLFRAIIRFRRHLKSSQYILNRSGDGRSLRSSVRVDRPYNFASLPIILFKQGEETAAEVYTVALRQNMPGDGEGIPVDEMTPEQVQKIAK